MEKLPPYLTRDMAIVAKTERRPTTSPTVKVQPATVRATKPVKVLPARHPGSVKVRRDGPVIADPQQHERHRIQKFAAEILRLWPWLSRAEQAANTATLQAMNEKFKARFGVWP